MSIDSEILRALRGAGATGVGGAELAKQLGVSRAAIWAHIEELRSAGYEIEASPHHGYKLFSVPDRLHADDLLSRIAPVDVIGRDIKVFQETTSTNDIIDRLARDGAQEGVVVFAESQTQGRGRLGRNWISPSGKGVWFSVLLRPALRPQAFTQLTISAATSLARAIREQLDIQCEIKWPNDVLIRGKKVAGILSEVNAEPDVLKYAIVGAGINANLDAVDFPPELLSISTSLKIELGEWVDRANLAAATLRHLDRAYEWIRNHHFDSIVSEWETWCSTLGRIVTIDVGGRELSGRAESLDENGALLLRNEHGQLERIIGGDVTLQK